METPVLLITFNRPQYLSQVLKALKLANVSNLYVFKDGPRPNNSEDIEKGKEIECLIDAIDWPCKVVKNFMNNNLGCGWGPYSAISWAFQYVDRLIILEDDCVPSTAFFPYCEYLLEKYSEDNRVRHISGFCEFEGNPAFSTFDYIFTQYAHTWGWATWKRVWNNMDMQERLIIPFFRNGGFTDQFATKEENRFFTGIHLQDHKKLFAIGLAERCGGLQIPEQVLSAGSIDIVVKTQVRKVYIFAVGFQVFPVRGHPQLLPDLRLTVGGQHAVGRVNIQIQELVRQHLPHQRCHLAIIREVSIGRLISHIDSNDRGMIVKRTDPRNVHFLCVRNAHCSGIVTVAAKPSGNNARNHRANAVLMKQVKGRLIPVHTEYQIDAAILQFPDMPLRPGVFLQKISAYMKIIEKSLCIHNLLFPFSHS